MNSISNSLSTLEQKLLQKLHSIGLPIHPSMISPLIQACPSVSNYDNISEKSPEFQTLHKQILALYLSLPWLNQSTPHAPQTNPSSTSQPIYLPTYSLLYNSNIYFLLAINMKTFKCLMCQRDLPAYARLNELMPLSQFLAGSTTVTPSTTIQQNSTLQYCQCCIPFSSLMPKFPSVEALQKYLSSQQLYIPGTFIFEALETTSITTNPLTTASSSSTTTSTTTTTVDQTNLKITSKVKEMSFLLSDGIFGIPGLSLTPNLNTLIPCKDLTYKPPYKSLPLLSDPNQNSDMNMLDIMSKINKNVHPLFKFFENLTTEEHHSRLQQLEDNPESNSLQSQSIPSQSTTTTTIDPTKINKQHVLTRNLFIYNYVIKITIGTVINISTVEKLNDFLEKNVAEIIIQQQQPTTVRKNLYQKKPTTTTTTTTSTNPTSSSTTSSLYQPSQQQLSQQQPLYSEPIPSSLSSSSSLHNESNRITPATSLYGRKKDIQQPPSSNSTPTNPTYSSLTMGDQDDNIEEPVSLSTPLSNDTSNTFPQQSSNNFHSSNNSDAIQPMVHKSLYGINSSTSLSSLASNSTSLRSNPKPTSTKPLYSSLETDLEHYNDFNDDPSLDQYNEYENENNNQQYHSNSSKNNLNNITKSTPTTTTSLYNSNSSSNFQSEDTISTKPTTSQQVNQPSIELMQHHQQLQQQQPPSRQQQPQPAIQPTPPSHTTHTPQQSNLPQQKQHHNNNFYHSTTHPHFTQQLNQPDKNYISSIYTQYSLPFIRSPPSFSTLQEDLIQTYPPLSQSASKLSKKPIQPTNLSSIFKLYQLAQGHIPTMRDILNEISHSPHYLSKAPDTLPSSTLLSSNHLKETLFNPDIDHFTEILAHSISSSTTTISTQQQSRLHQLPIGYEQIETDQPLDFYFNYYPGRYQLLSTAHFAQINADSCQTPQYLCFYVNLHQLQSVFRSQNVIIPFCPQDSIDNNNHKQQFQPTILTQDTTAVLSQQTNIGTVPEYVLTFLGCVEDQQQQSNGINLSLLLQLHPYWIQACLGPKTHQDFKHRSKQFTATFKQIQTLPLPSATRSNNNQNSFYPSSLQSHDLYGLLIFPYRMNSIPNYYGKIPTLPQWMLTQRYYDSIIRLQLLQLQQNNNNKPNINSTSINPYLTSHFKQQQQQQQQNDQDEDLSMTHFWFPGPTLQPTLPNSPSSTTQAISTSSIQLQSFGEFAASNLSIPYFIPLLDESLLRSIITPPPK